ncbi:MAG TPA: hypothetical protein VKD71_04890 [Gemmataceae bacterium]|nr:hypothetical protein [Gemmataceae bacterium]
MFFARVLVLASFVALAAGSHANAENKISDDLKTILEKADKFELLSLNPEYLKEKPADGFHGWGVLGRTTVKDADVQKTLLAALEKGVEENKGEVARCFNPRHGIRVTHGDKTADFVICFECYQVKAFVGEEGKKDFLVTRSPQPAFDKVLTDAKVPLPPARK